MLFKGFDVANGEEWASVLYQTGMKEVPYVGGAAVRNLIVGSERELENMQVFTTNESPSHSIIPFHHELAQTPYPPSHICFFCKINNTIEGGATPIIRSDFVYNFLTGKYPDFMQKIEEKGVKYVRTVPAVDDPSSAQGRSWCSMYHCTTREKAEEEMKKSGATWEWDDATGNCTITSKTLDAVRVGTNGNKVFFN